MAKLIKSTDIFESDDIFKGIRDSAAKTIDELNQLNGEITETANALKKSIGGAKFDSSKSIKEFTDATSKSNKLVMETIKIEELKQRVMQQSEKATQELAKSEQQRAKASQQSQKVNQESEKTDQQRIRTKREQAKLERELAREAERKSKLEARAAKLAQQENSAYSQLVKQTRELKNASKELAAQLVALERDGKKNTAEFREMSRQYTATTKAAAQADQQLKSIDQRVGDNFRNVGNYNGAISKLSSGLGMLGLSFGIGSIVSSATEKIIEFDQSIADLQAITGASGNDLEFYKKQANELGIAVEGGGSAVVEAYKLIGSAKPELLANASALNEVTKSAITLAQASGMTLPDAATALTDAMNQFGAPAEQAGRYINVLANGAKFGSAEIPQITESLLKFGAVAKTSNVSIEESTALIELLAEKGLKGADSGTALRNVMLKLSAPDALPKDAKDRLEALGISFETLNNEAIPFSERLAELKPLLNDNAALVKTFGTENAVAATSLLDNIDRIKELESQMYTNGTAMDQAAQRTNTLGHALMELKNEFFAMFTEMGSGSGSMQFFIDSLKWVGKNLGTIMSILGKVVASWIIYRTTLASIKAYQFIMSGGLKELGKSLIANISLTKQAANTQKQMGDSAIQAGDKVGKAGKAIQAIPWMLIIGFLVEVATKWYDVASGAAEARRQADMYAKAKEDADKKSNATIEKEKKRVEEQLRLLDLEMRKRKANGESQKKLDEEKSRRTKEIYTQSKNSYNQNTSNQKKELTQMDALMKRYDKAVKNFDEWNGKRDGMWDWSETKQDAARKELQAVMKLMNATSGYKYDAAIGVDYNVIAQKGSRDAFEKSLTTQKNLVDNLDKGTKDFNDALDEAEVAYMETTSSANDYSVSIANNTGKVTNNLKQQQQFQTELDKVNDYLMRTIDLMQQLNQIQQQRDLAKMESDIEAAINNAVKLVKETGTINVGVAANTQTGEFGSMYDPIEQMIIDRYAKEAQFIKERTDFAIAELQRQFDRETQMERDKLIDERDTLLKQENITTEAKTKINANYDKRLAELDVEQKQRASDLELDKKVLTEKSVDEITKLEETKNDKINEYNDKLLTGEEKFHDERNDQWKKDNDETIKSEKEKWKTISEFVKAASDLFIKQSEKKVEQIDKELEAAKKQYDTLQTLAANGNINAQQSLAEQQRIINEKEKQKAKELKRQQRIKLAESVFSTYSSKVESGSKNPLAETIRDTTLLTQFIAALPTFESGIEDTGANGRGIDGKGGFHAVLHPNERVVPKALNERIGSLTNEQLSRVAWEYQNGKLLRDGDAIGTPMETALLIQKIDELKSTIANKPETNIQLGEITQSMMEIVRSTKSGNTTTYNRYKIRK